LLVFVDKVTYWDKLNGTRDGDGWVFVFGLWSYNIVVGCMGEEHFCVSCIVGTCEVLYL